jgi:hypothetical protein
MCLQRLWSICLLPVVAALGVTTAAVAVALEECVKGMLESRRELLIL